MIDRNQRSYNQKIWVGCGSLLFLFLVAITALALFSIRVQRQAAQYPGASPLSSHNNYTGLPGSFKWDDAYITEDEFNDVYAWYSINFGLGAESRASERCIYLEGIQEQLMVNRYMGVHLCNTKQGQRIYVSRTIWFDNLR